MTATAETVGPQQSLPRRRPVQMSPPVRAPFSLRCGAILVDYILLVSIVALSTLISRMLGGGARAAGNSSETIGYVLAVVFAVLDLGVLPGLTGLTVGKWATGLRIRRADGSEIGIGRAFLRHFVGYPLSLVTLGLGFLIAAFSERGRGLHDLIAGTRVVRDGPALRN
ncbi:MAG TPA: RDD family protein [Pyrinomonadaceae bacterium]|nr:RDD family protein [Pyrinomonadaceae bacterium]